ncbi:hypothetical protein [Paenibacillus jilunlii]|uniref:hypothetical protein n=1 Tax=Paenibacillus jilunlii TaxID=682956 RepID=UPI00147191C3|nr:hypothetical protein [Paenibacillus jilunlii]
MPLPSRRDHPAATISPLPTPIATHPAATHPSTNLLMIRGTLPEAHTMPPL